MRFIMKIFDDLKQKKYLIIAFLFSFLPRVIISLQMIPVRTVSDEIASFSGAALFSGNDWSSVVSNAGYYGVGFTSFLAPILWLTDDPYVIYRSTLVIMSLLQAATAIVCYLILEKELHINKPTLSCVISVACSYFVVTRANIIYNEHVIILISWLVAYLLIKLNNNVEDRGKKKKYTLILCLLISYSLTIHTRNIMFLIGLFVLIIVYYFLFKKWLINFYIFIPTIFLGVMASQIFINFVQGEIWNETNELRNSSIILLNEIGILLDPVAWHSLFNIVTGQIFTIILFSSGIMIYVFTLCIPELFTNVFHRDKLKGNQLKSNLIVLFIYFITCICITIIAQSVSGWLTSTVEALHNQGFSNPDYSFKVYTYIRYFGVYCGPILLCVLMLISEHTRAFLKSTKRTVLLLLLIIALWVCLVLPFIHSNGNASEVFMPLSRWKSGEVVQLRTYLIPIIVMLSFLSLFIFLLNKKKLLIGMISLTLLFCYQYTYNSFEFDLVSQRNNEFLIHNGYKLIKGIEQTNLVPKEIYVEDISDKEDHQSYYLYQFYLNRYKIIPYQNDSNFKNEDVILFTNREMPNRELLSNGFRYCILENKELMYVRGVSLINAIEEYGYTLYSYNA